MSTSLRGWHSRRRPAGFVAGVLFLAGAVAVLLFLAVLAALSLVVVALVGAVMAVERLLGLLVPAYRRRRRERYLTVPAGLVRVVRFGSGSRSGPARVVDARSYELPTEH